MYIHTHTHTHTHMHTKKKGSWAWFCAKLPCVWILSADFFVVFVRFLALLCPVLLLLMLLLYGCFIITGCFTPFTRRYTHAAEKPRGDMGQNSVSVLFRHFFLHTSTKWINERDEDGRGVKMSGRRDVKNENWTPNQPVQVAHGALLEWTKKLKRSKS